MEATVLAVFALTSCGTKPREQPSSDQLSGIYFLKSVFNFLGFTLGRHSPSWKPAVSSQGGREPIIGPSGSLVWAGLAVYKPSLPHPSSFVPVFVGPPAHLICRIYLAGRSVKEGQVGIFSTGP